MFFKKNKADMKQLEQTIHHYAINGTPIKDFVKNIALQGSVLTLNVTLPESFESELEQIHRELGDLLKMQGISQLDMNVSLSSNNPSKSIIHEPKPMAQDTLMAHPRIRHIIAVASGKGGVGKSTTAVNVALALKQLGNKVGMLDADIYGPSLPDMLGLGLQKPAVENGQFVPLDGFGMPVMSIGCLLDGESTPVAWRGIKATGALMQLYEQTAFGHLDYLIIDMPPGTGDIALTLAQKIPITGAIIVTTPQHIALLDVKKGIELFNKTHIPIIGIVENMALHTCKQCGHTQAIFGDGGAKDIASHYGVPLLGKLPLAGQICEQMDKGMPSVAVGDEYANHYHAIAQAIDNNIAQFAKAHDTQRIF